MIEFSKATLRPSASAFSGSSGDIIGYVGIPRKGEIVYNIQNCEKKCCISTFLSKGLRSFSEKDVAMKYNRKSYIHILMILISF